MNWGAYSRLVGNIFGAPLAMEGLAAFFLESTFLGLWLFGLSALLMVVSVLVGNVKALIALAESTGKERTARTLSVSPL